jgi:hypothetical protein
LVLKVSDYLGKLWADRIMREETAKHSAALETMRSNFAKELEQLRASIARAQFEFETRFSKLHETRAAVIAELYSHLVDVEQAARMHLPGPTSGDLRRENFEKCLGSAGVFFRHNAIYFEKHLCESIREFLTNIGAQGLDKMLDEESLSREAAWPDAERETERGKRMMERNQYVLNTMPALKEELAQEFRTLLGVPDGKAKANAIET